MTTRRTGRPCLARPPPGMPVPGCAGAPTATAWPRRPKNVPRQAGRQRSASRPDRSQEHHQRRGNPGTD